MPVPSMSVPSISILSMSILSLNFRKEHGSEDCLNAAGKKVIQAYNASCRLFSLLSVHDAGTDN